MQSEWKYCFEAGACAEKFLHSLMKVREAGMFLGSTYPAGFTHSCFTEEQAEITEAMILKIDGLRYQRFKFFRGNLIGSDFGMDVFSEPFVQWCPSPIYSMRFAQRLLPQEPWGYSMEGALLFEPRLEEAINITVVGLTQAQGMSVGGFNVYRISFSEINIPHVISEILPLEIDCNRIPEVDILTLDSGVVLCSSRFAMVLKRSWKGMAHAKFQPVRCLNVAPSVRLRNLSKIAITNRRQDEVVLDSNLSVLEHFLGVALPRDYKVWVLESAGKLPSGWLSPMSGGASELALRVAQEQREAEPSMPRQLIPLYDYGNGDYLCYDSNLDAYVRWEHEVGSASYLVPSGGLSKINAETGTLRL